MANQRETVRFYTDVMCGFDPKYVTWQNGSNGSLPPEVSPNYKRIWIEVEMPSDLELWPERLSGFEIGSVRRRQIQVEETRTVNGESTRSTRRIDADADPRQPGN